ncbi:MAG: DUF2007 domain-containing protein [Flavobacterium sp.]|jgi:hypothetical protein
MNEMITVATFNLPTEIAVLKSILMHRNIPHFFDNETIVSIDPFASFAYGGIKLKIHLKDFEEVTEILNQLKNDDFLKIV